MVKEADGGNDAVINCRGLWKVFGRRANEAMRAITEQGLGKLEVRDRYDCVIGVKDASFQIRRGEVFCVMGLSGSGKSTLIRHINRLVEPTQGEIFIEGQNVNVLSARDLRALRAQKIGMVFQNVALMPHRTVIDNVGFSLEVRGKSNDDRLARARHALEVVDLEGWDQHYPDELSGGMQQRVGLARAFAADPPILLMDEPFSALDPLIRRQLQDKFKALSAEMQKTTVFITHDLDEAIRIGDRIAIMKDGELVQIGTPEDIVTNPIDDYVADFVEGISKLGLVSAGKIMAPMESVAGLDTNGWPRAAPGDSLDRLVDISIGSSSPIIVEDAGAPIGVVTDKTLLNGIRGDGNRMSAPMGDETTNG